MTGHSEEQQDPSLYRTIARPAQAELRRERSLFLGRCARVETVEAARAFIEEVSAAHRDATHNCFAYRIGSPPRETVYYSDRGEPAGTAGKPILGAILHRALTDVVVVVTRYFGGKRLGVRGLIEAYGQTAALTLEKAGVVVQRRTAALVVRCPYRHYEAVLQLCRRYQAEWSAESFAEEVTLSVRLRPGDVEAFSRDLSAFALGRVTAAGSQSG
ncbi:MAG: YigZ family protein [Bacillota bacterium]|nr:YigZ family protein [Bacillota bacterium]